MQRCRGVNRPGCIICRAQCKMKTPGPLFKCCYDFQDSNNRASNKMWARLHSRPRVTALVIGPQSVLWEVNIMGHRLCRLSLTLVPWGRQCDLWPPHHVISNSESRFLRREQSPAKCVLPNSMLTLRNTAGLGSSAQVLQSAAWWKARETLSKPQTKPQCVELWIQAWELKEESGLSFYLPRLIQSLVKSSSTLSLEKTTICYQPREWAVDKRPLILSLVKL